MTNPTPVAWLFIDGDFQSFMPFGEGTAVFTTAQLQQARADALREAAERFDGCYVTSNHPQIGYGIAAELRRMAAEIEGEK